MSTVKLLFLENKLQILLTKSNISNFKSDNNLYIGLASKSNYDSELLDVFQSKLNNGLYNSDSFEVDGYEIKIQVNKNGEQRQINFGSTGQRIYNLITNKLGKCNIDGTYVLEIDVNKNKLQIYEFFNKSEEFRVYMDSVKTRKNEDYAESSKATYYRNLKNLYEDYEIYFATGKPELIMLRDEFPALNKNNNEYSATINFYVRFLKENLLYTSDDNLIYQTKNITEKPSSKKVFILKDEKSIEYQQKILIGPPGSGKSYNLNNEELGNVTRIVFHPEYDNSDFVGSILPKVENGLIDYKFRPGPFTEIYRKAVENPSFVYTLLIEEMTRGNCAAIFGDIFQLLDRNEEGYSEYGITNVNISNEEIKLPPNLNIVGTVNSSDQNVFPMDTAFKRRFDLEYINPIGDNVEDFDILGVSWKQLCTTINNSICNNEHLAEDKQIGFYFIKSNEIKDIKKLCIYLWHDVDKFIHDNNEKILNRSKFNNFGSFSQKISTKSTVSDLFNKVISKEFEDETN